MTGKNNRIRRFLMSGALIMALSVPMYTPLADVTPQTSIVTESKAASLLTKAQAKKKLKKWLKKKGYWYKKAKIAYERTEGKKYLFRVYEVMPDHEATSGWYYVHRKTGKVTSYL